MTIQTTPTVDAVYIDRARRLLMELRAGELLSRCEERSGQPGEKYTCICLLSTIETN